MGVWEMYTNPEELLNGNYSLLNSHGSPTRSSYMDDDEDKAIESLPVKSWRTTPLKKLVDIETIKRLVLRALCGCIPSFLEKSRGRKPRKITATSYLDGVRGVAALFVVIHHHALAFTTSSSHGWKSRGGYNDGWFFQVPLVRLVHSGRFMVAIFFVLSGYVLSHRGLKLARDGDLVKLMDSLSSSVFRRWIRLCVPVITSTYIGFLLTRFSMYQDLPTGWQHKTPLNSNTDNAARPKPIISAIPLPIPPPPMTFNKELWAWFTDTADIVDPFRFGVVVGSKYNLNVLWTIPSEIFGSMIVFITIMGIGRTKPWVKITILITLIYWAHLVIEWPPALFFCGILIAELSFIRAEILQKYAYGSLGKSKRVIIYLSLRIFWTAVFIGGLFIGSHPQDSRYTSLGYKTLMRWTPKQYGITGDFWISIGAPMVILALENAPFLQRTFMTRFAQYLGKISFSLYLLHFMVMSTLCQWLVPKCMNLTGGWENGQLGFNTGMAMALCVSVPVTFCVSDVFSTLVDERSLRFARWVNERAFVKI